MKTCDKTRQKPIGKKKRQPISMHKIQHRNCYFSPMKQHKLLQDLLLQLYAALFADQEVKSGEANERIMMERISSNDANLYQYLLQFINAYQSWMFIKQDYELRTKVKDIWLLQSERACNESIQTLEQLQLYCKAKQLEISWPSLEE